LPRNWHCTYFCPWMESCIKGFSRSDRLTNPGAARPAPTTWWSERTMTKPGRTRFGSTCRPQLSVRDQYCEYCGFSSYYHDTSMRGSKRRGAWTKSKGSCQQRPCPHAGKERASCICPFQGLVFRSDRLVPMHFAVVRCRKRATNKRSGVGRPGYGRKNVSITTLCIAGDVD
jgi:hypothetical protein